MKVLNLLDKLENDLRKALDINDSKGKEFAIQNIIEELKGIQAKMNLCMAIDPDRLNEIEELQEIYTELKSKGTKIPGRVRELIASDIGLSSAQIGNYQQIIKHATPELREKLENDEITLKQAVSISSMEDDDQMTFLEIEGDISLETIKEYKNRLADEIKDDKEDENVLLGSTSESIGQDLLEYVSKIEVNIKSMIDILSSETTYKINISDLEQIVKEIKKELVIKI